MNFFTRRRFDLVHDLSASARKQSVMEYRLPRMDVEGEAGGDVQPPSCRDREATLPHESWWILYEQVAVCLSPNLFVNLPSKRFFGTVFATFKVVFFQEVKRESELPRDGTRRLHARGSTRLCAIMRIAKEFLSEVCLFDRRWNIFVAIKIIPRVFIARFINQSLKNSM